MQSTQPLQLKSFYKILNVIENANTTEIINSYKMLAEKYYSLSIDEKIAGAEQFQELETAYEVIGNKKNREIYDTCRIFSQDESKIRQAYYERKTSLASSPPSASFIARSEIQKEKLEKLSVLSEQCKTINPIICQVFRQASIGGKYTHSLFNTIKKEQKSVKSLFNENEFNVMANTYNQLGKLVISLKIQADHVFPKIANLGSLQDKKNEINQALNDLSRQLENSIHLRTWDGHIRQLHTFEKEIIEENISTALGEITSFEICELENILNKMKENISAITNKTNELHNLNAALQQKLTSHQIPFTNDDTVADRVLSPLISPRTPLATINQTIMPIIPPVDAATSRASNNLFKSAPTRRIKLLALLEFLNKEFVENRGKTIYSREVFDSRNFRAQRLNDILSYIEERNMDSISEKKLSLLMHLTHSVCALDSSIEAVSRNRFENRFIEFKNKLPMLGAEDFQYFTAKKDIPRCLNTISLKLAASQMAETRPNM